MDYLSADLMTIHQAFQEKKITPLELVKAALQRAKENQDNAFEIILENEALAAAENIGEFEPDNLLWGIPYTLKDNIATKGIPTTGGSNILNGYRPTYDATVYKLLQAKKAILIGKTTLDEFGMGGRGTSGHLGRTTNPYDSSKQHLIGGSSAGSAVSVAAHITPFSLGSDTGDSIRKPASFANIIGYKPTWGLISRFGLFSFCPSLDHVGFFTNHVSDAFVIFNALNVYDPQDATNYPLARKVAVCQEKPEIYAKKVAIIPEILDCIKDSDVLSAFHKTVELAKKEGMKIEAVHVSKEILRAILPTYMILSSAEATSNNANLDGIKFGPRDLEAKTFEEVMIKARTDGFGAAIKRRFVLGSFSLMKENQNDLYLKSKKARQKIVETFNQVFQKYDFIMLPATPSSAPRFDATDDQLSDAYLIADNYMGFANFGGYPSLTIPLGFKEGLPFGLNLTAPTFADQELLSFGKALHDVISEGGSENV